MSQAVVLSSEVEFEEVAYNETKNMLVMASLKAPLFEKKEEDKRAPIDICCVIDRSGSMSGDKIKLTQEALEFVVQNLEPQDSLSVVTYDDKIETLFNFTQTTDTNKAEMLSRVHTITARGSTDLCGGLLKGLEHVAARTKPNEVCSILLLTDGLANHGISEKSQIEAEMKLKIEALSGKKPSVFTFGFGSDHNEDMLRGIAETGAGMYYYVKTAEEIPTSFADCLGGLQSVVAQNLRVKFESLEGCKITKSLSKYKCTTTLPSNKCEVQIGDLYSEEGRDLIFMVEVPSLQQPHDDKKLYFKFDLEYFNVISVSDESYFATSHLSRPGNVSEKQIANLTLDKQRNRLTTASVIENSRNLAEKGKFIEAQKVIQDAQELLRASASGNEEFTTKLVEDLGKCLEEVNNKERYLVSGKKMMMKKMESHSYQRSNRLNEEEEYGFYETSSKMDFKMKSKK